MIADLHPPSPTTEPLRAQALAAALTQWRLSPQPTPFSIGQQSWRMQKRLKKKGRRQLQADPHAHSLQPKGSHMEGTLGLACALTCASRRAEKEGGKDPLAQPP